MTDRVPHPANSTLNRRSMIAAAVAGAAAAPLVRAAEPRRKQDDTDADPAGERRGVRKGRIKQSSTLWCYGRPIEELAAVSAALGLYGVDVVNPPDWPVLKKYGLVSTMTPCMERGYGIANGLNKVENHEGHLQLVKERIDQSAEAGFRNIVVFSGNREDGLSDRQGLENCARALRQIAPYAEKKGQLLLMELLNSKRDHKGYMCDRTAWGVELVQKVGSPAFKLIYDIYHMQIQEGDVIATIREFHQSIGHYQTAGVPGRRNLDDNQELHYPAIMRAIAETGYDGAVGHEFIPSGDPREALAQAVEWCDV